MHQQITAFILYALYHQLLQPLTDITNIIGRYQLPIHAKRDAN